MERKLQRLISGRNLLPHTKLDRLIRQSQDGQSVGLPVGPDSSRIVAEIVASAVDVEFSKKVGLEITAIRHVDDVWIGADSMDQAESLLYSYRECLREFNLDINDLKTSIAVSSDSPEPPWPLSIKMTIKDDYLHLSSEDKTRLLSEMFKMAYEQKDDGIIKYAIRRFDRERLWSSDWSILEAFLIRCVTGFPHSIDYVARVLAWANRRNQAIMREGWIRVISSSLLRNSNLGNDSEVCWLLWLMKELAIPVSNNVADTIVRRCGAFAVVMLFSLKPALIKKAPKRQALVVDLLGITPFRSNYWLLSYEAAVNNWLPENMLPRSSMSAFMKAMVDSKVSFFNAKARPLFLLSGKGADADKDNVGDYAIEDTAGRYDDDDDEYNDLDDEDGPAAGDDFPE